MRVGIEKRGKIKRTRRRIEKKKEVQKAQMNAFFFSSLFPRCSSTNSSFPLLSTPRCFAPRPLKNV
jgi:hypothetical protein